MQLTIERNHLLAALSRLNNIVPKRHTVPILSSVLLTANDAGLTVQATNLDMEGTITVAANVSSAGQTCAPADSLLTIAKNAAEGADISLKLGERLGASSGRSNYRLAVLDPTTFPTFAPFEAGARIELTGEDVRRLLGRVMYAVGQDEGRFVLCGAHIHGEGKQITVLASDQNRIARSVFKAETPPFFAILPTAAVREFIAIDGACVITIGENKARIQTDTIDICAKLISQGALDIRRAIPTKWSAPIRVDRDATLAALRRMTIATGDSSNSARMKIEGGAVTLTARNAEAEASDEIDIEYDGEVVNVGINTVHMVDAISAVSGDFADLAFMPNSIIVGDPLDESLTGVVAALKA